MILGTLKVSGQDVGLHPHWHEPHRWGGKVKRVVSPWVIQVVGLTPPLPPQLPLGPPLQDWLLSLLDRRGGRRGGGDEQNSPEAVRLCCVQKIGSSPGTLPHSYAAGGRGDLGGKAGPTLLYGPQACYTPLMPVLAMTKTARP